MPLIPTAHTEKPEGREPTLAELKKCWNLLRDYERAQLQNHSNLAAALRCVRGLGKSPTSSRTTS